MDHLTQEGFLPHLKTVANWIAAVLGIGTFAGLVNVMVGLLSGVWIAAQLWTLIRYEVPLKRAKLRAAHQRIGLEDSDHGGLQ